MSGPTMLTLKDGYQLREETLTSVLIQLKQLKIEDYQAFIDLVEKCRNTCHLFVPTPHGNSKAVLIDWQLMSPEEIVNNDIRAIVRNAVEGSEWTMRLVNPVQLRLESLGGRVSPVEDLEQNKDRRCRCAIL